MTQKVLTTRSINTQKADIEKAKNRKTWKKKVTEKASLAKHGFGTDKQQNMYLGLGSLFWITVMLIGTPQ